jgi:hypothetical protein
LDATGAAAADGETTATATSGAPAAASATATAAATAAPAAGATAAAAATATTAPAAGATAPAAAAAAATASGRKLQALAEMRCPAELLVKDVEGTQADVGDFLLTEHGDGGQRGPFDRIRCRGNRRRCAAGHRQRHSSSSPSRQGYLGTLASFRLRHFQSPPLHFQVRQRESLTPESYHGSRAMPRQLQAKWAKAWQPGAGEARRTYRLPQSPATRLYVSRRRTQNMYMPEKA